MCLLVLELFLKISVIIWYSQALILAAYVPSHKVYNNMLDDVAIVMMFIMCCGVWEQALTW